VFYNIGKKHPVFTRMSTNHPTIMVVLASAFGLGVLSKSAEVFIDGTFQTTECKLVLTILMGLVDGVAIPCAYLLSNSRETTTYKTFFEV
jgi:hypothetical protein